jgi:hypothetical protein
MATRSRIGIEHEDGTVESIYCHWDGYPSNNGNILQEDYRDPKKVEELIKLGDISSLAPEVKAPKGHSFETPVDGVVVAYCRDRGEGYNPGRIDSSIEAYFKSDVEEYGYVFTKEGKWLVNGTDLKNVL